MRMRILLLLISICFSPYIYGQDISTPIVESFQKGDVALLEPFLDEEVLLTLVDQKTKNKKLEAVKLINRFFVENKVRSFTLKHKGVRDESAFLIGVLETIHCQYRVNCHFKKNNKEYFIHQIRIDKANE